MQTKRLFDIIYLLLTHQHITAKELSEHCQVSIRTIYRDIDRISQAGIPIYTQKGNGGGVSLLSDFVLDKVLLNQSERQSILQALQAQDALNVDESTADTLTKLSALFGQINEPWLAIDLSRWYETDDYFEHIKSAILLKQVISFTYYNAKGQCSVREVEPLQLVFKSMSWYLKAYCLKTLSVRFFKLSRMTSLVIKPQSFSRRGLLVENQEKKKYSEQKMLHLVMQVSKHLAYRIYDDFPLDTISRLTNGDFLIDGMFPKEAWLYSYILSLGEHAKVMAPDLLKLDLIEKIERMRALYHG